MQYKRETVRYEVDTIETTPEEFSAANKMFREALTTKYPSVNVSDLKYDTIILTDGLYRAEFKVRVVLNNNNNGDNQTK
jgi:hypothetical protein